MEQLLPNANVKPYLCTFSSGFTKFYPLPFYITVKYDLT